MFLAVLTIMAAPVDVAANQPVTLEPIAAIEFANTTQKNTDADCLRVMKALSTSKKIAFCSPASEIESPVASVTPASAAQ